MQLEELEIANRLFDAYHHFLPPAQNEVLLQFLKNGFEVNEIAVNVNSSKQAVSKNIKCGLKKLGSFENDLHFLSWQDKMKQEICTLDEIAKTGNLPLLKTKIANLKKEL